MANIMSVRPSEEIRQALKKYAKRKGVTLNHLVIDILWDWAKKNGLI